MSASSASSRPGAARSPFRGRALGLGVVLLVLLGTAVLLFRQAHPPLPIPVPVQLGTLDIQVRDYLTSLARKVADAPVDSERRIDLGLAFAVNGLWPEARQCFLDAGRLGSKGPLPALYAAVALQEIGDAKGALTELRDLVRRHSESAAAWYRLGHLLATMGEFDEAAAAYETVTRLAPNEWRGWAGLGEARLRGGRREDAVSSLEKAVKLDPYARSARHVLSQALRAVGRTAEADREAAAGKAQTLGPMPDDWSLRALAHMKGLPDQFEQSDQLLGQGEEAAAIRLLEDARRYHPTNTAVLRRLALAYLAGGRAEEATSLVAAALQRLPNDVGLILAASETAAATGRAEDALLLSRRALELAPRLAEAHVAEANALLANERDAEAADALNRALELDPRNTTLLLQLGDLLVVNLGKARAAMDHYVRVLDLDPIHPAALERLAGFHLRDQEWESAAEMIARLRALDPSNPTVHRLEKVLTTSRPQ
ncbi:MAG: tetratricopeptide repeat protein [Verrucomicrobiales bacterium]|nr:tetratricopeptide repeat protein [Verrucomicrobiales bacterium]